VLEIAVVRQRAPIAGQQSLVTGVSDRGLLQHGDRLRPLPRDAQRFPVIQGRLGVIGMGAMALLIEFQALGGSRFIGLVAERSRDVR
jgi:hypothetical protein